MNDQIQAVRDFENYLAPLRVIYSNVNTFNTLPKITSSKDDQANGASNNHNSNNNSNANTLGTMGSFNLHMFLIRQRLFLHGKERNKLKYIPKVIRSIMLPVLYFIHKKILKPFCRLLDFIRMW